MKKKTKKLKAIQKLLENFSGIESESFENHTRKTISIQVSSNEDICNYISELLKVCYYCLDGNGMFVSPGSRSTIAEHSVTKVIDLILELLPHNQMHCMDRITEILQNTDHKDEK
jgi:hypothetical protein